MPTLSPSVQQAIREIAQRHGFSVEATLSMLDALNQGHGRMAQFNHPEFSGSGQWMQGGMTMVSDLFDHQLKARVDALCSELSKLLAGQPGVGRAEGSVRDWWPAELGLPVPDSTGSQNGMRYAYFGRARRLAVDVGGQVTVYDTLDHQIGGFSQQQPGQGALKVSSQHGPIDLGSLPVVSSDGRSERSGPAVSIDPAKEAVPPSTRVEPRGGDASGSHGDVLVTIEKLAGLHAKGILSEDEFRAKKAELLARL